MPTASHFANKIVWLDSCLRARPKVLIAAVLAGGAVIAFPATSALVVVHVGLTLAAIGIMAWTGLIAFASIAAAVLIVPVATIASVCGVVAGVRWLVRTRSPRTDPAEPAKLRRTDDRDAKGILCGPRQEALDDWETDGGPAARGLAVTTTFRLKD